MLELQDCDNILNLPKEDYCNHNMVMRRRMAAQAELSLIQNSESPKMHEADNKKESQVESKTTIAARTRMQLHPSKKQCNVHLFM